MPMDIYTRGRLQQMRQQANESDAFWDEVMASHRHLSPSDQVALADAVASFRAAQASLSAALKIEQ